MGGVEEFSIETLGGEGVGREEQCGNREEEWGE